MTDERKIQPWGTFNSFFDGMIPMISQEVLVFSREKVEETNVKKPGGLNSVREEEGGRCVCLKIYVMLVFITTTVLLRNA